MGKLLVVEDDEQLLFIISKSLENAGYDVLTAQDGQKAIKTLNKNFSDVSMVITDIIMPDIDGIQLCNYIRSQNDLEHLPILIITGQGDIYNKCQGFNAGADDYITKPIEFVEFMLRVKALLKRGQRTKFNTKKYYSKNSKRKMSINKDLSLIEIDGQRFYLTQTEFDIINYLYLKKSETASPQELLENILGYPKNSGNPVTIRTHIRNIRAKLKKENSDPDIIINIPKRGYMLNPDYEIE